MQWDFAAVLLAFLLCIRDWVTDIVRWIYCRKDSLCSYQRCFWRRCCRQNFSACVSMAASRCSCWAWPKVENKAFSWTFLWRKLILHRQDKRFSDLMGKRCLLFCPWLCAIHKMVQDFSVTNVKMPGNTSQIWFVHKGRSQSHTAHQKFIRSFMLC